MKNFLYNILELLSSIFVLFGFDFSERNQSFRFGGQQKMYSFLLWFWFVLEKL